MTSAPLPQPRPGASGALRAVVFGLALGISAPLFADSLADAQRLIRKGQYPQALAAVDRQLAGAPDDPQARFLKGVIYSETGKTEEAIAVYSKLNQDYPEFPEPYNNLAVLYARQKQYEKARMALDMAIQAHPSYATAYENLGDLYAKLANQAYGKAVQLEGASKLAKTKLDLSRNLISPPAKAPAEPATAAPPAGEVATGTKAADQ
jgi:tetratricopeptide (TPR) repeat protein